MFSCRSKKNCNTFQLKIVSSFHRSFMCLGCQEALTFKVLIITIVADNNLIFSEKIRLNISCDSSA